MQLLLSTVCLALTSAVIGNAYYQKKQFYPAVVYITKSNASMAVIYIQFFVIVFMFGKLLRKIFLGTLRAAEFEHLIERFWYALTETCLAFTVFRDDFNPRFVALFTVLLFLKSFHWLAEERVDFMERSPVLGWLFHIRVASLLASLGVLDYVLLMHAYNSTLVRGPTVQLVFGFEYAILLTVVASTAIKYVLHAAEMRTDTPWENKAVFLLYTELVIGLIKVILYVLFVVIMAKIYALPMFVFRPMFFTIRNFKKALSDVIMSRRAIRNMNTLYPDATPEELQLSDNICIICREDMINHSKKLPCGHIFHTTCLRSWFQRQQTCPTCRLNILRAPNTNSTAMPRQEEVPVAAAAAGAAAAAPGAQAPNIAQQNTAGTATAAGAATTPDNAGLPNGGVFENLGGTSLPNFSTAPNFQAMHMVPPPFMMPPPFPFIAPYAVPPPPMPPDLTNFSDEELRALEGNERHSVEERIKLLRNIQLMLDAAGILMNNYQIVAARMQIPNAQTQAHNAAAAAATVVIKPPVSTETTSAATANEASTSAATTVSSNDPVVTKIVEQSNATTSAAAAAAAPAAAASTSPTLYSNDTTSRISKPSSSPTSPSTTTVEHKDVTIEDIGGEDHDFAAAAASTSTLSASSSSSTTTNTTTDNAEIAELSELRKRRLKFLEERNKSTTE